MSDAAGGMHIPEYVRRELSEVYLLMDHVAGQPDKSLQAALDSSCTGVLPTTLKQLCEIRWPPAPEKPAEALA